MENNRPVLPPEADMRHLFAPPERQPTQEQKLYALLHTQPSRRPRGPEGNSEEDVMVYIGITGNLPQRIKDHGKDKDIQAVYLLKSDGNELEEALLTALCGLQFRIDAVKGGPWANRLSPDNLTKFLGSILNMCFAETCHRRRGPNGNCCRGTAPRLLETQTTCTETEIARAQSILSKINRQLNQPVDLEDCQEALLGKRRPELLHPRESKDILAKCSLNHH